MAATSLLALLIAAPAAADDLERYRASWIHRALALQYELSSDMPFRNLPWVATHNSYNSAAELGASSLSARDPNQVVTIIDQLEMDVRGLEVDTHLFPSQATGTPAPVVCHARPASQGHVGCSGEKLLADVLDDIAAWLRRPANREEVIFLYLEDHLNDANGYDMGGAVVRQSLGDLLYAPAGPGCTQLPDELSRSDILAAGRQMIIVSDCGPGSGWNSVVHAWDAHEESRPFNYSEFPACGKDYSRTDYDTKLIRYYEDATALTATASNRDDRLSNQTTQQMARCGVDLTGFDRLLPFDGRLESMVWSWASGQPGRFGCAVQRVNAGAPWGRWYTRRCRLRRFPACRKGERWILGPRKVRQKAARRACRRRRAVHAAPRTGYETQLLRLAMKRRKVREAWLGYRVRSGEWTALDRR